MKLILKNPVKPLRVNQSFGENPQMYANPKYGGIKGHNGIDFRAMHGEPVYAAHDGTAYYEYDGGQGEGVVIRTNEAFDYEDGQSFYKTIYWHLCDQIKEPKFTSPVYKAVGYRPDQTGVSQVGVSVKCGDLIGYADNTGASSGDHLHFGLKPQAKNESNGAWLNFEQNNGYGGAIDPAPYFENADEQAQVDLAKKTIDIIQQIPATPQQKWQWLEIIKNFLLSLRR